MHPPFRTSLPRNYFLTSSAYNESLIIDIITHFCLQLTYTMYANGYGDCKIRSEHCLCVNTDCTTIRNTWLECREYQHALNKHDKTNTLFNQRSLNCLMCSVKFSPSCADSK